MNFENNKFPYCYNCNGLVDIVEIKITQEKMGFIDSLSYRKPALQSIRTIASREIEFLCHECTYHDKVLINDLSFCEQVLKLYEIKTNFETGKIIYKPIKNCLMKFLES